jgi:FHA domain-containing protein
MGALSAVERFLERLFEGQSARLFRTRLRPIQVQRRLERAIESNRVRDGNRTVVPHRLVVRLSPDDLTALRSTTPGLAATLADNALAFARAHGYTLLDRPTVTLRADARIEPGDIAVDAATRGDASPSTEGSAHDADDLPDRNASATVAPGADPVPAASSHATAVFVVPGLEGPHATIREIRPDHTSRAIELDCRAITLGRAPDNGLVLRDGRASRHHARIDARRGSLVLTDLGSTNGSWVNDRRVESVALGVGDQIRLGTTVLVVEAVDDTPRQRPDAVSELPRREGPRPSGDAVAH